MLEIKHCFFKANKQFAKFLVLSYYRNLVITYLIHKAAFIFDLMKCIGNPIYLITFIENNYNWEARNCVHGRGGSRQHLGLGHLNLEAYKTKEKNDLVHNVYMVTWNFLYNGLVVYEAHSYSNIALLSVVLLGEMPGN